MSSGEWSGYSYEPMTKREYSIVTMCGHSTCLELQWDLYGYFETLRTMYCHLCWVNCIICDLLCQSLKVKVTQVYPSLCDTMNYSPPGSCVHEILQARI